MKFLSNLGCMQGRLSPMINNKIQSFPNSHWKDEFLYAKNLGLKFIEWTLDYNKIFSNPIFVKKNIRLIQKLSKKNSIKVISLTGDCFMQKPFWKKKNHRKEVFDLKKIIKACSNIGIKFIIVPLVDNGSIKKFWQEKKIITIFNSLVNFLKKSRIVILFESDFGPEKLKDFIKKFNPDVFGINYDTGNSAALGFDLKKEFYCYGNSIKGVHIKDRILKGGTVRLGNGNVNFKLFFKLLKQIKYKNHIIFQTARSENNKDIQEMKINLEYISKIIRNN
jgi:L-ribulose-5-phosphate 3-epimerase